MSYIWKGGVYAAPDPGVGQEWCFVYGEKDWLPVDEHTPGKKWEDVKNAAQDIDPDGAPQTPIGRVSCE